MSVSYTKHGDQRANQRGFPAEDIEQIRRCGTHIEDRDAEVILVTKKDVDREVSAHKKEMRRIERLCGCTVVISDNRLITVFRPSRAYEKKLLRRRR